MLRFSYTNLRDIFTRPRNKDELFEPLKVTATIWDFFQLERQLNMALYNSEQNKSHHMHDWFIPDSLKGLPEEGATYMECYMFSKLIRAFMKYIDDNRENIERDDKLCLAMITTVIAVKGQLVVVNTTWKPVERLLHDVVKEEEVKYQFNPNRNALIIEEKEKEILP